MNRASPSITDILTREEIRALTTPSNLQGALSLTVTWGIIAASFALVALYPNLWTVLAALALLGGRQLALAVLMHECSHRSLFASKSANDILGHWLCGAPVWTHLRLYRKHHLAHHNHTGTEKDPDIGLVKPFPVTRASLIRKFLRDLTGIAAIKRILAQLAMDSGLITYTASTTAERIDQSGRSPLDVVRSLARNTGPVLLTNLALFGVLYALGHGWLYLLWVGAYATTFSFFLRIRALAEHACTEITDDVFRNTRTTYAPIWTRLFVAPHHVNFHLEHHLLMTVPHYRLKALHALLHERGALKEAHLEQGYGPILKLVSAR